MPKHILAVDDEAAIAGLVEACLRSEDGVTAFTVTLPAP